MYHKSRRDETICNPIIKIPISNNPLYIISYLYRNQIMNPILYMLISIALSFHPVV